MTSRQLPIRDGLTHASSVIPVVRCSDAASLIVIFAFVPLNTRALPYFPRLVHVAFEIVPGLSSAIAVPAYAGIPLTHRDFASSFTVFTGHQDPAKEESAIDYRALVAGKGTLVMLMGAERLASIVTEFLAHGADLHLPVALIRWGTTGRQETLVGELGSIVAAADRFRPPAIAVFGRVVELRAKLRWFEKRPLFGGRIVVTR